MPASLRAISHLYGNKLTSIPSGIGQLSSLKYLRLGSSKLMTLPDTLWQLTGLERLILEDNKLTSIPSGIGQLSSLKYLNLDFSKLVSLPDSIIRVKHVLLPHTKTINIILEDIQTRRLNTILLAKPPILETTTELATTTEVDITTTNTITTTINTTTTITTTTTKTKSGPVYDVLTNPILSKMIVEYMD